MKRISRLLAILIMVTMTAAPCSGFATEEGPFDAPEAAETTEVTVVDSVEELSQESEAAYDNEAFFTIDASKDDTSADFATDEISDDVSDILSGGGSTAGKQEDIVDTLEDSGFYRAEGSGKSEVDVTSRFAYQRLRLTADKEKEINAYGATRAVYFEDSYLLSYDSMEATKAAYDALVSEYGSEAVLIDVPLKLSGSEKGWGTSYMNMSYAKTLPEYSNSGNTVTVAVIDTGIMRSHKIFTGRTILSGYDFANGDSDPDDKAGHGTAVSGVIAESTPSNVVIMPLKALNDNGEGSILDIVYALRYANDNGADIINMSLGGYLDDEEELAKYERIFAALDPLIVCAAGNEEKNLDDEGIIEFPGELSSTVCVGAFSASGERSWFSNYGKALDFAAPGESVLLASISGTGSYSFKSGRASCRERV